MKRLRAAKGNYQFQLGQREKQLLFEILKRYPCIPPAHQRLSKSGALPDVESTQHLLDEALAEQRLENKKKLAAFMSESQRFVAGEHGVRFSISPADLEWLLQVLNDVRVGSWIKLGSPEELHVQINEKTLQDVWTMEAAGDFQMQFLAAAKKAE